MPLNWDDDNDDEPTEIEYKKRARARAPEQPATPMAEAPILPTPSPLAPTPYLPPTEPPLRPERRPVSAIAYAPASIRDRFAACLIDSLLGFYLYWLIGWGLLSFFNLPTIQVLHQGTGRFALHLVGAGLLVFLYYVAMESVLGATLGKIICRLRVIEENGQPVSLGNAFIRNFLRLVDYPLFFLIAVIAMESSPLHQRVGDRAAKTLVIKKTRRYLPALDLAHTPLASTLSRLCAEALDLVLSLGLLYGVFLLMRPGRPLLSYVMYLSAPILFILYYATLEFLTGTTPGKALLKRQVVLDNGEPPDGSAALLRNIFRPLDYLLGYPLMVLTRTKQRLGDIVADTLVIVQIPTRRAWVGTAFAIIFVLGVLVAGFRNTDNYIRRDYGLSAWQGWRVFLPKALRPTPQRTAPTKVPAPDGKKPLPSATPSNSRPLPASTSDKLKLAEFYFATGPAPAQIRKDNIFRSGDLVFVFFKVQGLQLNEKQEASIREDLLVEGPDGKTVVNQPNIVELKKALKEEKSGMLFANQIKLSREAPVGKYKAVFTVYDTVAETQFSFEKTFELQ